MRKLDRVLVNEKWNMNFPLSEARFFPSGMSDHSPIVVKVIWQWLEHKETIQILRYVDGS